MTARVVVDESQVLGSKIAQLESWFRRHPGVYDAVKRDELRTLYTALGDETKAFQQSDIILSNQPNDKKTIVLLSQAATATNGKTSARQLIEIASRFPQFTNVSASARLRAADLLTSEGRTKAALDTYKLVFDGPETYASLAREKYQNLEKAKERQNTMGH